MKRQLLCTFIALCSGALADKVHPGSSKDPTVTPPSAPAAVTELRAVAVDGTSVVLEWTDNASDGL
jgi:hypothetical protein